MSRSGSLPSEAIAVPRPAASLILLRAEDGDTSVLMGRRAGASRFMPGRYVFPGGVAAAEDRTIFSGGENVSPDGMYRRTALRETYEETGLLLGRAAEQPFARPEPAHEIERAYVRSGIAPRFEDLVYLGHAVTPRESPLRFNARFFLADGAFAHGRLEGNGELDDLGWRHLDECRALPLTDVTRFMLELAVERRTRTRTRTVLYYYTRGIPRVRTLR